MSEFVTAVAGERSGIVDAFVRRSATRCAEALLNDPRVREALDGKARSSSLAMDLFCAVYTLFFVDVVTEFARAAVAEQVKLALPGLVIIDPAARSRTGSARRSLHGSQTRVKSRARTKPAAVPWRNWLRTSWVITSTRRSDWGTGQTHDHRSPPV